ncbi:MAG: hypothetical protein WCL23_03355 [Candidatus Moraniibacteriota bacterium]
MEVDVKKYGIGGAAYSVTVWIEDGPEDGGSVETKRLTEREAEALIASVSEGLSKGTIVPRKITLRGAIEAAVEGEGASLVFSPNVEPFLDTTLGYDLVGLPAGRYRKISYDIPIAMPTGTVAWSTDWAIVVASDMYDDGGECLVVRRVRILPHKT